MAVLLGPDGKPITSRFRKADPPKTGEAFGAWAGRDLTFVTLPGGGVVQFDLSKLTIADYRVMRDHYQVNASLAVLSFMQHQSDWHIECEDKKIADYVEENLRDIWTTLNRSMSTANWAGYSPNALNWENDVNARSLKLDKIKDLVPEECVVNWKEVEGWAPPGKVKPKFKIYDGIKQFSMGWPIPVENSFWYSLLMENGDYYGRKLLRPAFTSWFFSILVHLFANRYYERFGEPTPVGRAPFDEDIETDDGAVRGNAYMLGVLEQLRSRSVVVLPNDRTQDTNTGRLSFDYDISYLESQMRGADFERYLTRLDEEISIGLFTPILLLRTADVGSYNLGVGHMQMYLWMLNAMNDDRALYINKYIIRPMVNFNFSKSAPDAKIVFRKMGNANTDLMVAMISTLMGKDKIKPDIRELGQMAGMTLDEIEETVQEPPTPTSTPDGGINPGDENTSPSSVNQMRTMLEPLATLREIENRVRPQIENAFRDGTFGAETNVSLGYKRKFEKALEVEGLTNSVTLANDFYERIDRWVDDVKALGMEEFSGPDSFMGLLHRVLHNEVDRLAKV